MSYQDRFYESYKSTHTDSRRGVETIATLEAKLPRWDRVIGPLLPESKEVRILDCACGNGGLLWWLNRRGYVHAEGHDLALEQVKVAAELGIPAVHHGDFRVQLRSSKCSFDVIILSDVLEHFPKNVALEVLDEIRAALRPRGRLILHTPNAASPMFGRIRYGDFTHENAFTESSIRQVLAVCGFVAVVVVPSEVMVTSVKTFARKMVWRSVATGYKALNFIEVGHWPSVVTQNLLAVGFVE